MFFLIALIAIAVATLVHDEEKVIRPRDDVEFVQILQEIAAQRDDGEVIDGDVSVQFSWQNCDSPLPVNVVSFNLAPDPVVLGKNLTIGGSVKSTTSVGGASLAASVTLEKDVYGVWVEIPCVDHLGSCTYDDLCSLLKNNTKRLCPILQKLGLPCSCPFAAGLYKVANQNVATKVPPNLPSWLETGSYYVQLQLYDAATEVFCVEVYASIKVN